MGPSGVPPTVTRVGLRLGSTPLVPPTDPLSPWLGTHGEVLQDGPASLDARRAKVQAEYSVSRTLQERNAFLTKASSRALTGASLERGLVVLYRHMAAPEYMALYPLHANEISELIDCISRLKESKSCPSDEALMEFAEEVVSDQDPSTPVGASKMKARFQAFLSHSTKVQKDRAHHTGGLGGTGARSKAAPSTRAGAGSQSRACPKCHGPHALAACRQLVAVNPDGSENLTWQYAGHHPRLGGQGPGGLGAAARGGGKGGGARGQQMPVAMITNE